MLDCVLIAAIDFVVACAPVRRLHGSVGGGAVSVAVSLRVRALIILRYLTDSCARIRYEGVTRFEPRHGPVRVPLGKLNSRVATPARRVAPFLAYFSPCLLLSAVTVRRQVPSLTTQALLVPRYVWSTSLSQYPVSHRSPTKCSKNIRCLNALWTFRTLFTELALRYFCPSLTLTQRLFDVGARQFVYVESGGQGPVVAPILPTLHTIQHIEGKDVHILMCRACGTDICVTPETGLGLQHLTTIHGLGQAAVKEVIQNKGFHQCPWPSYAVHFDDAKMPMKHVMENHYGFELDNTEAF